MSLSKEQIGRLNDMLDRADNHGGDVATKVDADGKYIRTPWTLCEEIVGQIAAISPLQGKKILVVDTVEFIPVLLTFGAEKCNITYVAPYSFKGSIARKLGVRVVQQSLLEWKPNMKFDVVVGNPPYQDAGGSIMYFKFHNKVIETCLNPGGYFSFVTPNQMVVALITGVLRKYVTVTQRKIVLINIADYIKKEYFLDVGSTFCYYILQNEEFSSSASYELITNDGRSLAHPSPFKMIINTPIAASILQKCFDYKKNAYGISQRAISSKAKKNPAGTFTVAHRINQDSSLETYQVDWTGGNIYLGKPKVFISGFGDKFHICRNHQLIGSVERLIYTVPTGSDIESENLVKILDSKLQRFYTKVINARGRYVDFMYSFEHVDLSRSWTDAELYAHFNLTQEEIDYIEATVK